MSLRLTCSLSLACAACSSSAAPPPASPAPEPSVAPSDASVDVPVDAGPSEALTTAPAWVFRYASAQRTETWTLRIAGAEAMLDVASANGTLRYLGSATDGNTLALRVATANAKMALDCKRTKRAVGAKCNDAKAKKLDVLDCYHADFKEPMPFGPEPGIEYADGAGCTGYRLIAR